MIKFIDILNEDASNNEADNFTAFLQSQLDLENLKSEYKSKFGELIRSEEDFAVDYYNIIDDIANKED